MDEEIRHCLMMAEHYEKQAVEQKVFLFPVHLELRDHNYDLSDKWLQKAIDLEELS